MKGFSIQRNKRHSSQKARSQQMLCWAILASVGLNITACSSLLKPTSSESPVVSLGFCMTEQLEIERLQKLLLEKEAQQQEIERLQKTLAEKEAQIRTQQVRQQDQARTLQETTSQAIHTQVKLRRLATRPAAASAIAEVEVAMENLKSSSFADSEQVVRTQAQRLLNAAAASYAEDNHAAAMDYAAHARGFIDMINNNRTFRMPGPHRVMPGSHRVTTPFEVPIPLRATVNSNLRQEPGLSAPVLRVLKKDSAMTAGAYRGNWLQVQTADGLSGWVLDALVEVQVGKP